MVGVLALFLAGCGSGDSGPTTVIVDILSDQPSDGDIAFDPVANSFTVTQGPDTLFFGIDILNPNFPEFRAFLDFPLDGSTGYPAIPLNATIVSSVLKVSVTSVEFARTIPALIDLVSYPVRGLTPADFNSDPLTFPDGSFAFLRIDFLATDVGIDVAIDVTSLMQEAQRRGLADFQVRYLLDFVPNPTGFVGIDDQPTVAITAPRLTVEYF
jgi:hypothetical protein